MVDDRAQCLEQSLVRVALRQQPQQCADIAEARQRQGARQQAPRPEVQRLHAIGPEMFVEPRAPDQAEGIAGLQRGAEPQARPAQSPRWRPCARVIASTIEEASP